MLRFARLLSHSHRSFDRGLLENIRRRPGFGRALRLEPLEDRRLLSVSVLEETFQTMPFSFEGEYSYTATYIGGSESDSGPTTAAGSIVYSDPLHGVGTVSGTTTSEEYGYFEEISYYAVFYDNNGTLTSSVPVSDGVINATGTFNTAAQGAFTCSGTATGTIYVYEEYYDMTFRVGIVGSAAGDVACDAPDLAVSSASWTEDGGVLFSYANLGGPMATSNRATAASNVKFFWASGETLDDILGDALPSSAPIYWNQAAGTALLPRADLGVAPAGATHLLAVADADGSVAESDESNNVFALRDTAPPVVLIGSPSPAVAAGGPVEYVVSYSDPNFKESTLSADDVVLNKTGTADGVVSVSGSGDSFVVTVSNITGDGTLGISLAAGTAVDHAGNWSDAADGLTFVVDNTAPTVTVNQAAGQPDPTNLAPIRFTVVFSEPVVDFTAAKVTIGGTAGATLATVSGSGTAYVVTLSGMTRTGTVTASVAADKVHDAAGNGNTASTGADNTVNYVAGPVLSNIVVVAKTSADKTIITWSASGGEFALGATTLTIDGIKVSVAKKSTGKTTANFSFAGQLTAGNHQFTITSADAKGKVSTHSGAFNVAATIPVISAVSVKASFSDKKTTIKWSVSDIDGVAASQLTIDGVAVVSGIKPSGKGAKITYTYTGYVGAGAHTFAITAADAMGKTAAPAAGAFFVAPTVPTISKVKVAAKTSDDPVTISWTGYDCDGIQYAAVSIDGRAAVKVNPLLAPSAINTANYLYSAMQSAGKHVFAITLVDAHNVAKIVTGSFTVKASKPTISNVPTTAGTSADQATISWNAYDIDGIAACMLKIDGKTVDGSKIAVNRTSSTTAGYVFTGALSAGKHSFVISVVDTAKASTTLSGSLTVQPTKPTISSPTIGTTPDGKILATWAVFDIDGVASAKLTIGGKSASIKKTVVDKFHATFTYTGAVAPGAVYALTAFDSQKASTLLTGTLC